MSQHPLPLLCEMTELPVEQCACPIHGRPPSIPLAGRNSTIVDVRIHGPFWQMWLKSVTGVDLNEHCMKSLRGPNADGLGSSTPKDRWTRVITAPVRPTELIGWYLCGVSYGNILERNAHLFAIPEEGSEARLEWSWGEAVIENARAVPITDEWIDPHHPKARIPVFRTCRNWQVAWMITQHQRDLGRR